MIDAIKMEFGEAKPTPNVRWERIALSQISEFITKGSTPTTFGFNWVEKGIPFLRSECVTDDGFNTKGLSYISVEANKVLERSKITSGDILITITGNVGRIAIYPNELSVGNINQHIARVRISAKEKVDSTFVYYQLKNPAFREYYNGIVTGAAYPQLSLKQIRDTVIVCPSLETQQRISSILSAYDDLIEVNNQRIKLLEETAREFYKEWFVRMRFPGYKKAMFVKGVPEGIGEVKYFKDFIKLNRGFDLPEERIKEGNYPVIASTSIKGYHNQYKVRGPIITTGRSGSLGTVLFVNQDGWPLNTSLYVKDFKGNEPLYVYYTLKLLDFESFNSGAGVPTLNQNHLHKLKMWVADEILQKKFKQMVEPMFQQVEILNQQNTQLRQIRDRLLPRLISGKLEVKSPIPTK